MRDLMNTAEALHLPPRPSLRGEPGAAATQYL